MKSCGIAAPPSAAKVGVRFGESYYMCTLGRSIVSPGCFGGTVSCVSILDEEAKQCHFQVERTVPLPLKKQLTDGLERATKSHKTGQPNGNGGGPPTNGGGSRGGGWLAGDPFAALSTSRVQHDDAFEQGMGSGHDSLATARHAEYTARKAEEQLIATARKVGWENASRVATAEAATAAAVRRGSGAGGSEDDSEGEDFSGSDYDSGSDDDEYFTADFTAGDNGWGAAAARQRGQGDSAQASAQVRTRVSPPGMALGGGFAGSRRSRPQASSPTVNPAASGASQQSGGGRTSASEAEVSGVGPAARGSGGAEGGEGGLDVRLAQMLKHTHAAARTNVGSGDGKGAASKGGRCGGEGEAEEAATPPALFSHPSLLLLGRGGLGPPEAAASFGPLPSHHLGGLPVPASAGAGGGQRRLLGSLQDQALIQRANAKARARGLTPRGSTPRSGGGGGGLDSPSARLLFSKSTPNHPLASFDPLRSRSAAAGAHAMPPPKPRLGGAGRPPAAAAPAAVPGLNMAGVAVWKGQGGVGGGQESDSGSDSDDGVSVQSLGSTRSMGSAASARRRLSDAKAFAQGAAGPGAARAGAAAGALSSSRKKAGSAKSAPAAEAGAYAFSLGNGASQAAQQPRRQKRPPNQGIW